MKLNEIDAIETKQNQNYKQLSQAKPHAQQRRKASRTAVSYYLWLTWTDPKVTLEAGLRSQVRNGLGNRVFSILHLLLNCGSHFTPPFHRPISNHTNSTDLRLRAVPSTALTSHDAPTPTRTSPNPFIPTQSRLINFFTTFYYNYTLQSLIGEKKYMFMCK